MAPHMVRLQILYEQLRRLRRSTLSGQAESEAARSLRRRARQEARLEQQFRSRAPADPTQRLSRTRLVRRRSPTSIAAVGWRVQREEDLSPELLWAGGVGPDEQLPVKAHHKCGICPFVKSHPVSHCYVCIRVWLVRSWTCPECVTPMHRAPFRHYGEEASIADAYPEWRDESRVDYSWEGLVFPKPPPQIWAEYHVDTHPAMNRAGRHRTKNGWTLACGECEALVDNRCSYISLQAWKMFCTQEDAKPENRGNALAYADLYHGAKQYFLSPRSLHLVATTEASRNVLGRVHDPLILKMISVVIKTYNTSTILHGLVHERLLELQ
ncbi:hypothetical protein B0H11DRAFT_2205836 [Mycena galericulata]|nr:hypothetical protein B0H11DRAFT_2205836 [Mycena galericulata]